MKCYDMNRNKIEIGRIFLFKAFPTDKFSYESSRCTFQDSYFSCHSVLYLLPDPTWSKKKQISSSYNNLFARLQWEASKYISEWYCGIYTSLHQEANWAYHVQLKFSNWFIQSKSSRSSGILLTHWCLHGILKWTESLFSFHLLSQESPGSKFIALLAVYRVNHKIKTKINLKHTLKQQQKYRFACDRVVTIICQTKQQFSWNEGFSVRFFIFPRPWRACANLTTEKQNMSLKRLHSQWRVTREYVVTFFWVAFMVSC